MPNYEYDIVICGGRIIDTVLDIDFVGDIYIKDGIIVKISKKQVSEDYASAEQIIDATGKYITPGLIDFHAHIYYRGTSIGIPPECECLSNCVTTAVDAGTVGASAYEGLYMDVVNRTCINVKSLLYVASCGQPSATFPECIDPRYYDVKRIKYLCEKFRENIIGLKIKHSKLQAGMLGSNPLRETVKLGHDLGLFTVAHVKDPACSIRETAEIMQQGDVFCHVYHDTGETILGEDGKINPAILDARERGVLFEVARARGNMSQTVARKAMDQGFYPDIISSDLSMLSLYKAPIYSFMHVLSEFLNLGMPFREIIRCCTENPAKAMKEGKGYHGFIKEGQPADLAIMSIVDRELLFEDRSGNSFHGKQQIKPEMTIKDGIILFRQWDFL